MFAAQASLIVMAPVLSEAASDLNVSTSTAGQLRTVAGLAAALTALLVSRAVRAFGLGRLLLAAALLIALSSLASAAAPGFALLVAAQVPLGAGVGLMTTSATLAAAEWVAPELRTRTLSWTLVGQPAAWIVGMPLAGVLGEHSWRYAWLALPFAAALVAAALVASRRGERPSPVPLVPARAALADATVARWLAAELLANAAWAGTLVYAGALFAQSYGTSGGETGCLLALAAVAYVAGNLASRRLVGTEAQPTLLAFTLVLALLDAVFGLARPGVAVSSALLAGASLAAGGRTLVTSSFALGLAAGRPARRDEPPRRIDAARLLHRRSRRGRRPRSRRLRRPRGCDGSPLSRRGDGPRAGLGGRTTGASPKPGLTATGAPWTRSRSRTPDTVACVA